MPTTKHLTRIPVRQAGEGNLESWEVGLLFVEDPACSYFCIVVLERQVVARFPIF